MADIGREDKETFQKYANRIDRNARVYGIQDNNDMVIHQLTRSIPSKTYDFVLSKYQQKGPEALTSKSISAFCTIIKTLHGPDDALASTTATEDHAVDTVENTEEDTVEDIVARREEDAATIEQTLWAATINQSVKGKAILDNHLNQE
ncbi:hypothetical protein BGZ47_011382 [Haplosporangium gracile]|nr:hypothetical protein BGZ47_011382 [Haplosporangium gracile]